jgi:hypothetical protein
MITHRTVYRDPQRFAGWPANYGIWNWGSEVVVGFTVGAPKPDGGFHARSREEPFVNLQARSLDGGTTWMIETPHFPAPGGRGLSADEHVERELTLAYAIEQGLEPQPLVCQGGIDFCHPDGAVMCARTGLGAGTQAFFYVSTDRAHTWHGPYRLPGFGLPGVEARTDIIVNGPTDAMFFLTAAREDGGEGAGVFMARTRDGGKSFQLQTWVCQTPAVQSIMPASVRVDENRILTAVRCASPDDFMAATRWIDLYVSDDNGQTFQHLNRPAPDTGRGGNPPTLTRLPDGRIVLIYGVRTDPFGIRARISTDRGDTWGEELILRGDGGTTDLGYPRTALLPDGSLVTAYYFNDTPEGERYIAATLWKEM